MSDVQWGIIVQRPKTTRRVVLSIRAVCRFKTTAFYGTKLLRTFLGGMFAEPSKRRKSRHGRYTRPMVTYLSFSSLEPGRFESFDSSKSFPDLPRSPNINDRQESDKHNRRTCRQEVTKTEWRKFGKQGDARYDMEISRFG